MTDKELEALNGEVKVYKLGKPMTWGMFSEMPDDLKKEYIQKLRTAFEIPDAALAGLMGVSASAFSKHMRKLGLGRGRGAGAASRGWFDTKQCGEFVLWWCGIRAIPKQTVMEG
jgi:hypothetical protein